MTRRPPKYDPSYTKIFGIIPKAPDLEVFVQSVKVDNVLVVDFRDKIPSADTRGRGYWIPATNAAVTALRSAVTTFAKNPSHEPISISKTSGLRCLVQSITVEAAPAIEFRDFYASENATGRGFWMPLNESALRELDRSLDALMDEEGIA